MPLNLHTAPSGAYIMISIKDERPPYDTPIKVKLYNPMTMKKYNTVGMIKKIAVDWCLSNGALTPCSYRYEFIPYTQNYIVSWKLLNQKNL